MLHNLAAEIARHGLKQTELSAAINKSDRTFRLKMETGKFDYAEIETLRDKYFPNVSLEYLMSEKPFTGQILRMEG